jgi:hypothetical protein
LKILYNTFGEDPSFKMVEICYKLMEYVEGSYISAYFYIFSRTLNSYVKGIFQDKADFVKKKKCRLLLNTQLVSPLDHERYGE